MTICIADSHYYELRIQRKQIKYAYIRVKPNQVLEISAPAKMPQDLIVNLIKEKTKWILSVTATLEDRFQEEDIRLMPIPAEQQQELRYEAEDLAYEAMLKLYPLVEPFGVKVPEVRVRYMTSRWGSCIVNKNRIWINVYLIKLPQQCLAYVVLHELVHFIHPNHSKAFYHTLNQLMPEWKEAKEILHRVQLPPKNAEAKAARIE